MRRLPILLTLASFLLPAPGCAVMTRPTPTRDAGAELDDAPIPPGVDANLPPTDVMMRPDRGPLPPADTDADGTVSFTGLGACS